MKFLIYNGTMYKYLYTTSIYPNTHEKQRYCTILIYYFSVASCHNFAYSFFLKRLPMR